jgi:hypothetical protein
MRRLLTYGGSFMVLLTRNQTAANTAPAINTKPAPCKPYSQPPRLPPIATPRNWLVE